MDLAYPISGFFVGLMAGVVGVGSGSLMAPLLISFLGVQPIVAVGTNLWFTAITKLVGGTANGKQGQTDWEVVRRLCWGSLPATLATIWFLSLEDIYPIKRLLIADVMGVALVVTAFAILLHGRMYLSAARIGGERINKYRRALPALTVLAGAVLGVVVTLTSVGAGVLGAAMLVTLYPIRMTPKKVLGTDIMHAVPLALVAGIGHFWMDQVDFRLLVWLLVGSIPGVIVGTRMAKHTNSTFMRMALAGILLFLGARLLI